MLDIGVKGGGRFWTLRVLCGSWSKACQLYQQTLISTHIHTHSIDTWHREAFQQHSAREGY